MTTSRQAAAGPDDSERTPSLPDIVAMFARLTRIVRPYWSALAKGLALGAVTAMIGVITPFLSKLLIDRAYVVRDVALMHVLVLGGAGLGVAAALVGAIRSFYTQVIGARLAGALSLSFFNHLQHLPARFFDEHRVGEVMSRFQDVRSSLAALSRVVETVLVAGMYLLFVPPILLWLNWKLALVCMATVPLTATISVFTARAMRRYWRQSAEAYADLNALQIETLTHIRTFKTLAAEPETFARARDGLQQALQTQLRAGGWGTVVGLVNGVISTAGTAVFTLFAWTFILRGELTLGDYVAFTMYMGFLIGPVGQIVSLFSSVQQSSISLARMFEYLDIAPEQDPEAAFDTATPIGRVLSGRIALDGVSFGYRDDAMVLHDVTVRIEPGTVTALVGPSGAGKSSFLRLLCRLDDPQRGEVMFDGVPARAIALPDLRRQIAVVWQDVALVNGTLLTNLTLGVRDPAPEDISAVVRVCRLEQMVASLPQGLETPVAEWGATLSGGQRQRVAIARALLRRAPVLLLDEATSNIDAETEVALLADAFAYARGRTIVMVSHRLAVAALADTICVVEHGRLLATGAHNDLLARSERYRELYEAATDDDARRLRIVRGTR